jgi:hypothetical protein
MNLKITCSPGLVILITGFVLGNLEWILTLIYLTTSKWESDATKTACAIFLIA